MGGVPDREGGFRLRGTVLFLKLKVSWSGRPALSRHHPAGTGLVSSICPASLSFTQLCVCVVGYSDFDLVSTL